MATADGRPGMPPSGAAAITAGGGAQGSAVLAPSLRGDVATQAAAVIVQTTIVLSQARRGWVGWGGL